MNIQDHLKKEFWKRRVNPDAPEKHQPANSELYAHPCANRMEVDYAYYTQEDFLRENEPSAHDINSRYMSLRPVYDVREKKIEKEDGTIVTEPEWFVTEFEPKETVRFGLQKRINTSKAAFMAGNGFWVCHEDKDHELGEVLSSWKDSAGLNLAWQELVQSCYLTGDGAIYQYVYNGRLRYQVFSYLKGDILFPDVDENRNSVIYRLYTLRGKRAVDIYSTKRVQTWIEGDKESENEQSWIAKFGGWFAKNLNWASAKMSKDGWHCIADNPVQTPDGINPCTYWRVPDIPSGIAQEEICKLESAASMVADEVRSTVQAILLLKATNIESMPQKDSTGKVIGVKGSVDELAAADAKYVGRPNLSDIATIDLNTKEKSIMQSTMSVTISPDIFRASDPSSASIKLMFTDTIIWCKNEFVHLYPGLVEMVEVFKHLVAKIEGNGDIATMRTSCGCDFWIPQNDSEVLKRELDQVAFRLKSRKSAMSDIGNNHIEDYEQILKEWKEELDLKARVPAVAKAEVEKEYGEPTEIIEVEEGTPTNKPKIDNSAKGKSITE
ncbi:MAG: phage portal protein [Muribaculaceae bacterium]|nr:phage portal protein [Muribaculaceae bacterium]